MNYIQQAQSNIVQEEDISIGKYGETGLIQSKEKYTERKFIDIKDLNPNLENQNVWLRGRLHTSRAKGILFKNKIEYVCVCVCVIFIIIYFSYFYIYIYICF